MGKVKITETALRDGHQSLIATRMKTSEMIPILETIDKVGYHALEVWGGATFDACIRFLDEDPWERLREIRARVKNTKLQMLLRGQNLVGYRHYGDDIVEKFVQKSIENGIDIIRIFDALNDVRNIKSSALATKKYGGHCQIAIAYSISPVHTLEYYKNLVQEILALGADSIAIKDMAGILLPDFGYTLVKEIKSMTNLPVEIHTHATSGISEMLYMRAIDAGVDIIDTAISSFAGGTSQPATEPFVYSLAGTKNSTELNIDYLKEIADYFKPIRKKYLDDGTLNPQSLFTDPNILEYQVPGGMLSNLLSQLTAQKAVHRYEEVLQEIPKIRNDMGYPPLVTPLSQMIGTQAVFNIVTGERYKVVPREIKDLVKGFYGKTPAPIKPEIINKIIGDEKIITCRPADLIEPEFEKLQSEINAYATSDEDVLTYGMFPEVARKYFETKKKQPRTSAKNLGEDSSEAKIQNINIIF
ncbi:MAG: oxaloacetate decarboxylase subunit alpha [Fusobacteriaceae bacterium]